MGKHDILTEKEFAGYSPPARIIEYLEKFLRESIWEEDEIRILDWGCGRGRDVLWLREQGFEAYGVDVDPEPIKNGLPLIQAMGYPQSILSLLEDQQKTTYPDEYFHFIFSGNVFEHIKDLNSVVAELGRISSSDGQGFHVFPAHRQFTEGHLFMPFIHWFPKGFLRRMLISLFVYLGMEPGWRELEGRDPREKSAVYYGYSVDNLHYRRYADVRKVFQQHGFMVRFETISHPDLRNRRVISNFARLKFSRPLIQHLLLTYKLVELVTIKE